ncbi:hypothetical protein GQ457_11G025560 [Hibiscus cannabinus]
MCKTNSRIPVSEYRYPKSSIDTLSCRSAFNAGRKLPNGSIDDLTYQNALDRKLDRYCNGYLLSLEKGKNQ